MIKRVIAASLILILALTLTACKGEELPSAEEIISRAMAALEDVETYQFDAEIDLEITFEAEGESGEVTADVECSGAMDVTNAEMMINMDIDVTGTGEFGEDMTMSLGMEMYLIDNTMYGKIDMPFPLGGPGSEWIKLEMPEDLMEQQIPTNQMDYLTEMLELVEFKVTGIQKINGLVCYVLEFTPNPDELWELLMQQLQMSEQMEDMMASELEQVRDILNELANNISVKFWIAKDNYYLTRIEYDIALDITPEDLGMPEEEGRVTADMNMIFDVHEINQPISIELPPEAEDAVEIPSSDFPW